MVPILNAHHCLCLPLPLSCAQLNLSGNKLGPEGAKVLAPAIAVCASLTRVDVRHNNIVGDGASQLSTAVLGNTTIEIFNVIPIKEMRTDSFTTLDLKMKYIGVEGGMVVAGLLPAMASLTKLNLHYNSLKDEGVTAICKALQSNKETKLASLIISANEVGPVGAKAVAAMAAVVASVTEVR